MAQGSRLKLYFFSFLAFLSSSFAAAAQSRPPLGSVPYGQVISSCTVPQKIALTFDDGPYIYTGALLDKLNAAGMRGTFFVVGDAGWGAGTITEQDNPALIQRMVAEGHQVAAHTWSHPDMSALSSDARRDEMTRLEDALQGIIGMIPTYFRPPYLSCDAACLADMNDLGYHVISEDLDTRDYQLDYAFSEDIFSTTLASTPPTSSRLVLAHDVHQLTVERLADFLIAQVRAAGFDAVTVGECLGDPPANWYRDAAAGGPARYALPPAASASAVAAARPALGPRVIPGARWGPGVEGVLAHGQVLKQGIEVGNGSSNATATTAGGHDSGAAAVGVGWLLLMGAASLEALALGLW